MKRVEKIRAIQNNLLAMHEKAFAWAGGHRDAQTHYYLLNTPAKYNYDGWKRKVEQLKAAVDFLEAVKEAREELREMGAEDAIQTWDSEHNYNVTVEMREGVLIVSYRYNYLEELIRLVRPPVEATGELSEDEYLAKARDVVKNMSDDERLEFYLEGFRRAYEEAKKHLDWLEEELGEEDDTEDEG